MNQLFITGDTHGDFYRIKKFAEKISTSLEDAIIIAGDNGLRFYGENDFSETMKKNYAARIPITILAVRGNHDRPYKVGKDLTLDACPIIGTPNPLMWHDKNYPNIWYFQDGCKYTIGGKTFLIIGGAYSVDKDYRLKNNLIWYKNEQLSEEEKTSFFEWIKDKCYDYVITHTCPYSWEPTDLFLNFVNQSQVDSSMEKWLEKIKDSIKYGHWYFGHFHDNRKNIAPNADMLYDNIEEIKL